MTFFRLLHVLALFWMMAGLGSVMVAVWRAWSTSDIDLRAMLLTEAQQNETRWLLSGMLATGLTGFAWAASENANLITTGWLLALELVYAVDVFIFLPLLGVGLRRVRLLALQAQHTGEVSDELRETLADKGPVVFGTLMFVLVVLMTALSISKPF